MDIAGRVILWNLPESTATLMYILFGIVLLVMGFGAYTRIRIYRSGRREFEDRFEDLEGRLFSLLREGLSQKLVLRRTLAGGIHIMIYSGFIALFIATCIVALQYDFGFKILHGKFYAFFELFADTFGIILIAGIILALSRRYFLNPPGLTRSGDDLLQLILLLVIAITGFFVEGIRIAATKPDAATYSAAGNLLSQFLSGSDMTSLLATHRILWWVHLILAFGWIASLPYSKAIHIFTSPANMLFRTFRPKGALQPIPDMEEQEMLGAMRKEDLSWKALLSADACTSCGRCQDVCPAYNTDKSLSPREIVLKIKRNMTHGLYTSLVPGAGLVDKESGKVISPDLVGDPGSSETISPQELWECTTCRACMDECPVSIEHIDLIVEMRRGLVFESKVPEGARFTLSKLMNTGNPWGLPQDDRSAWMEGLEVPLASEKKEFEYLYWVSCFGAYDMRNQKVTKAVLELLEAGGIDFAILGQEEMCCGDHARRLGEEGLYHLGMVEANKEVFNQYNVTKIITQCPHCFNTFKNEYPQLGIHFEEVLHHSQMIDRLLRDGSINPDKAENRIYSYHDSCYLGRHNQIYDSPRNALTSVPGITLTEMPLTREHGFCCGGGGGGMWFEEEGKRINLTRFDQALETGALGLCTACPYCLTMFEDAKKANDMEEEFETKDIAEIVVKSIRSK